MISRRAYFLVPAQMESKCILRYASDLHLELRKTVCHPKLIPLWNFRKEEGNRYCLALLGDIGNPFHPHLGQFLEKVAPEYEKIFYVPGNHEYYNLKKKLKPYSRFHRELGNICGQYENIVLMNNTVCDLDCARIIGSTLWSRVDESNRPAIEATINDYHLIRNDGFEKITVATTNQWNGEAIEFISPQIRTSEKPCIVLTHHAPLFSDPASSKYTASPRYLDGECNQAFHNNLGHLMEYPLVAWLYGHTHYASSFHHGKVFVGTNQMGYQHEEYSINFNPYAQIDLKSLALDAL